MARDYKNKIDFKGQLLIEPKPREPTKHQYDYGKICETTSSEKNYIAARILSHISPFLLSLSLCLPIFLFLFLSLSLSLSLSLDAQTVIGFLKTYNLDKDFKVNIEPNHTTLAGHDYEHDLEIASRYGMLGSIDSNTGDTLLGVCMCVCVRLACVYDVCVCVYDVCVCVRVCVYVLSLSAK